MQMITKMTLRGTLVLAFTAMSGGALMAQEGPIAEPPQSPVVVELAAVGEAQGSGNAALLGTAMGQTEASVNVEGLAPGTQWSAFLVAGSCDQPGQLVSPLGSIEVGDSGSGSASVTVSAALAELTSGAATVQVHPQGETPTQAVLCGAVESAPAPPQPAEPVF